MEIDSNLLKEFAKMTNDSEVKSETKYLRGTIVKTSGGKYVQLDGSTTATPIAEIVDVEEGDRVLVSIENHKATIVGNFSFPPSARKEQEAIDKADAAQGTADAANTAANAAQQKAQEAAEKADEAINQSSLASTAADEAKEQATEAINKANSAQENIQEAKDLATQASADATEAKKQAAQSQASSAEAQAEVTRLQNEVTAAQEDIDGALAKLESQAGEIAGIKEEYALSVELDNTKAELSTEITKKVGELQATVEKDYATKTENVELEGRLQTQITQNAEGLTSQASKIEKLEADTTEAQKDVDAALAQAAAAQTTATEAQTKAQAAQDAANAATADANSAAEKAQLAQNAADAATATANAADQAVQQAQGDLDEAKQNLATVTSRVDATEEDIANAQAKVDAAQEDVNQALADAAEARLAADKADEAAAKAQQDAETAQGIANAAQQKADNAKTAADNAQAAADKAQEDVAALTQRITTAETKIEQNSEQVLINANKITETGEKIDNLKVGGRNYISYGRGDALNGYFEEFDSVIDDDYAQITLSIDTNGYAHIGLVNGFLLDCRDYEVGKQIVYSYDIMITQWDFDEGAVLGEWWMGQRYSGAVGESTEGAWRGVTQHGLPKVGVDCELNEWVHVSKIFTIPEQAAEGIGTLANIQMQNKTADTSIAITLCIKNVKIEYGNTETDWTPAPEDVDENIDGVKTDLKNNYYSKTETDAKLKVESDRITSTVTRVETVEKTAADAQTAADAAQEDINNLEIGGRNYIRETRYFTLDNTRETGWRNRGFTITTEDDFAIASIEASDLTENNIITLESSMVDVDLIKDKTICVSFDMKVDDINAWDKQVPFIWEYYDSNNARIGWRDMEITLGYYNVHTLESGVWTKLVCVIPPDITIGYSTDKSIDDVAKVGLRLSLFKNGSVSYKKVKVEIGTKNTDWTPAPEDAESSINDAQSKANNAETIANNAQATANSAQTSITEAYSIIQQLANALGFKVSDETGETLLVQDTSGWTYIMQDNVNKLNESNSKLISDQEQITSDLTSLSGDIKTAKGMAAYVTISQDDDNPYIELGTGANKFRVRITNTAIDFLEASDALAYANNKAFYAEKMIVKNELQIGTGPGFVWKTRSNGNMGLVYISS